MPHQAVKKTSSEGVSAKLSKELTKAIQSMSPQLMMSLLVSLSGLVVSESLNVPTRSPALGPVPTIRPHSLAPHSGTTTGSNATGSIIGAVIAALLPCMCLCLAGYYFRDSARQCTKSSIKYVKEHQMFKYTSVGKDESPHPTNELGLASVHNDDASRYRQVGEEVLSEKGKPIVNNPVHKKDEDDVEVVTLSLGGGSSIV